MEVVIERVSQYGFMIEGAWVNVDKKSGLDPKAFHNGDAVKIEKNSGGFITSVQLVTAAPPKKAFVPGKPSYQESPEKSAKMARGAAVKAVFSSAVVAEMVKDLGSEDALKQSLAISEEVANYIEKGL